MKVLVCDKISSKGVSKLQEAGFTVDVKTGLPEEELVKIVGPYQVLIVRSATKITKKVIDAAPSLKMVVRGGVGLDNVDGEYAKSKGIKVRNTPAASTESVAELVVGLFLALCRKIVPADVSMKQGKWEKKAFEGVELYKKTLGLIGAGRIGRAVARICRIAFQMTVVGYDPHVDQEALSKDGIKPVTLDELLGLADCITLHLPRTAETKHLLNDERFGKMKKGVLLVNCARGGVVSEESLMRALDAGTVAAAAIDVFEKEPLPADSPLLKQANVILTPHLGASTAEGQARVSDEVAETIISEIK